MLLDMRRLALAFGLVVTLAACSAGSSDGGGAGSAADLKGGQPAAKPASQGAGLTNAANLGRHQVRTSTMAVRVDDVAGAARAAVRAAEAAGGFLESEQTKDDSTTMTVRVPPERFTAVSDALARLGAVTARTVETEDVTGDVADVDGRLKAARASVARVRTLLGRASSIAEITNLESELTSRESDLESLETRQRALEGRTSYAAITVTFTPPVLAAATPKQQKDDLGGFAAGLRSGWRVFTTTVAVLLVILGAVLPFAGVAAAVGVPVWLLRRRATARA